MTTAELEQEYASFVEMVRKMCSSALRSSCAQHYQTAEETVESLMRQAIERQRELEARAGGNALDLSDLNREYGDER